MRRIAIIEFGIVINIASWDGELEWNPGDQYLLVDVTDIPYVAKRWGYNGDSFTPPIEDES